MVTSKSSIKPTAYDDVPYTSFPFAQTSPELANSIAHLFGLSSPAPATAKILEIGCASGNNLLSIAARYPNSKCTGIDLSPRQIEEGQKNIKALGVKNLSLEAKSILDVTPKFGKFDYIICHGVLSWVPQNVQEKILEICSENLTPNGVAYISYNTMPGWSAVKAIREMMLYHTARFSEPSQKAQQAKLLLQFISDSLKDNEKSFYADTINQELQLLSQHSDFYLLHDHLEENNTQYYFHQFMDLAQKVGLQYLGDTSLTTMYSGNLPKGTAETLATTDDIVRMEQYMDFISNRRFRSSLLCHKDRILRRNLQPDQVEDKLFFSHFTLPQNIANYKYGSNENASFQSASGIAMSSADPIIIAGIASLAEEIRPAPLNKIAKKVLEKFKSTGLEVQFNEKQLCGALASHFLRCMFIGGISLHLEEPPYVSTVSKKPEVFSLARYQSQNQDWVTTMRQESIKINSLDRFLMPLLDGSKDMTQIVEKVLPLISSGDLNLNDNDKKITEPKEIREKLPNHLKDILNRYAQLALLAN